MSLMHTDMKQSLDRQAVVVRDARASDMAEIQKIYAHAVRCGLASFEEVPPTANELLARREAVLALGLPYLAAELAGRVVGYSYATSYRPRPAYRQTVEDSVYVAEGMQGRGVGRAQIAVVGPWIRIGGARPAWRRLRFQDRHHSAASALGPP